MDNQWILIVLALGLVIGLAGGAEFMAVVVMEAKLPYIISMSLGILIGAVLGVMGMISLFLSKG